MVLDRDADFVNEIYERQILIKTKKDQIVENLLSNDSGDESTKGHDCTAVQDEEETLHFMRDEIKEFHPSFWLTVVNSALFISIISAYQSFSDEILKERYKYPADDCALGMIIPLSVFLLCAPTVGYSIDKIGKRMALNLINFSILMLNRF